MKILVKLFANFRQDRFKVKELELEPATCCSELLTSLGIAEEELGVMLINGRHAQVATVLEEGDIISLFPLVGGG